MRRLMRRLNDRAIAALGANRRSPGSRWRVAASKPEISTGHHARPTTAGGAGHNREQMMGEVADMMIDGTLCEGCGVFLNDEAPGFPCRCDDCAGEAKTERKATKAAAHEKHQAEQKKVPCPTCGRRVKSVGLADHIRDAHLSPAVISAGTHTKTPWRLGSKLSLGRGMGSVVADEAIPEVGGSDDVGYYGGHMVAESIAPRNAEFIVRACNAYAQLVNALEMVRDADNDAGRDNLPRIPALARATIDAALTAAGAA